MDRIIRKAGWCAALLVVSATAAGAQHRLHGTRLDTTVVLDRQATVDISLLAGRIEIVGREGTQAHIRAVTEGGNIRFDASRSRIRLTLDENRSRQRGTFELTVPVGVRVIANTVSASVSVTGVGGEADIKSVSGGITVSDAVRKVTAQSVSGNVKVARVAGDVRAGSVSGRVELDDVAGDLETETVSGRISMTAARSKYVRAGSVSGRIAYAGSFDPAGRYEFKSHSGALQLTLPANAGAQLRIESFSGSVNSDFPVTLQPTNRGQSYQNSFDFTIGNGRARIVAETFSGSIRIERGESR